MAVLYRVQGKYEAASSLYRKSLHIMEKVLGPKNPDVAIFLNNLALLYTERGKFPAAEALYERSLRITTQALGSAHPDVATSLINLAGLYYHQDRSREAEFFARHALRIMQNALSPEHPTVAISWRNLATLMLRQKKIGQGVKGLATSEAIEEYRLRSLLSEPNTQALLEQTRSSTAFLYGLLHAHGGRKDVRELTLATALLRKGRAADIAAWSRLAIRGSLGSDSQRQTYDDLQAARELYMQWTYRGPGVLPPARYQERLHALRLECERLEHQLVSEIPDLKAWQVPSFKDILPSVAKQLQLQPKRSTLVEVVWAQPYYFSKTAKEDAWQPARYFAIILFADQRTVAVDLGDAAEIERELGQLMDLLRSPASDPVRAAQSAYQRVMAPLQAHLAGTERLFLSLDGALSLVPFAALHDGKQYLLDGGQELVYLSSGRDLVRTHMDSKPNPPLLLGDPDFGTWDDSEQKRNPAPGLLGMYQEVRRLQRLPGTRREVVQLARLLKTQPRFDGAANEQAVRQAQSPWILHLATHGLFLEDAGRLPNSSGTRHPGLSQNLVSAGRGSHAPPLGVQFALPDGPSLLPAPVRTSESSQTPLLRAAVVLANAANAETADDTDGDGLLTADEVQQLNLWGTQLVVLSACDTGRGTVQTGDDIYGLRRAFHVAGAETVVASLWHVADAETGSLMTRYYEKLIVERRPRITALQEVMNAVKSDPKTSHPYYWAPFIAVGRDEPLHH